jgi:hypothetical protein
MKIKELLDVLSHFNHEEDLELRVCIPLVSFNGHIGGSKVVDISRISKGFDWDKGKLMLNVTSPICLVEEVDAAQIKKLRSDMDKLRYENTNLKRQASSSKNS